MEFNTGREEWDPGYVARETPPINSSNGLCMKDKALSLAIRTQNRQIPADAEPLIQVQDRQIPADAEPQIQVQNRQIPAGTEPQIRTQNCQIHAGAEPQVQAQNRQIPAGAEPQTRTQNRQPPADAEPQAQAQNRQVHAGAEPQTRTQNRQTPADADPQIRSQNRQVHADAEPQIRAQNRQIPAAAEPQIRPLNRHKPFGVNVNTKTSQTTNRVKQDLNNNKSKKDWAENTGLVTMRKEVQTAKEANDTKYLGPPPEGVQHMFMGIFLWHDSDILSGQDVRRQWDKIRVECHVFITYDESMKSIVLQTDEMNVIPVALARLRGSLHHAEADKQYCRPRYLVEPPSAASMRKEVLVSIKEDQQANEQLSRRVELAGARLSAYEMNQWNQNRMELLSSNEQVFMEHMKKAFTRLCAFNSGMRMRVQFGHIRLNRYQGVLRKPGFLYDDFVKMMGRSQTGAEFEKSMGGIDLGSRIVEQINQSDKTFCPLDVMIGKLSDTKPKQRILYITKRGTKTYRLEADIDISARGEYQLGANALFDEDTALKKRLDVGLLGFESKFHWSMEILTKERLHGSSQAIQDTVRNLLSSTEIKQDSLGFPYPSLRPGRRTSGNDKAVIHTVLQYKLMEHPYILEISLYRGIESEAVGNCGVSMYSNIWDEHMGPKEGEDCDRWELGSDLQVLFPSSPPPPKSDSTSGFRSFIATVEMIREFVSSAA